MIVYGATFAPRLYRTTHTHTIFMRGKERTTVFDACVRVRTRLFVKIIEIPITSGGKKNMCVFFFHFKSIFFFHSVRSGGGGDDGGGGGGTIPNSFQTVHPHHLVRRVHCPRG